MADIRQSSDILDDFTSYAQGDLLAGEAAPTLWGRVHSGFWCDNEVAHDASVTHQEFFTNSMTYWKSLSMDGDDAEAWGRTVGGGDVNGTAWQITLLQNPSPGSGPVGYRFRWESVGDLYTLRRHDGSYPGSFIDTTPTGPANEWMLIRRNGSNVEGWVCPGGDPVGGTWTLVVSAADTTYTTSLYGGIGVVSNFGGQQLGWQNFGAGAEDELPQIYRRPNE